MNKLDMPDAYLSEDLPTAEVLPPWKKAVYSVTYGNDVKTQPKCPECGRPMYYRLNCRSGVTELVCASSFRAPIDL